MTLTLEWETATKGGWINPRAYGPNSRQWLGHSFRYYLARGFLKWTDIVIDAGCGVGYGSNILSWRCKQVYGLDSDERALAVARDRYGAGNIEYRRVDLDRVPWLPPCDVAVCFETIEHVNDPAHLAMLLTGAAKRMIVLSAPVIPTVGKNPHHRNDFTEKSLRRLILDWDGFELWEQVRQGPYGVCVFYRREG